MQSSLILDKIFFKIKGTFDVMIEGWFLKNSTMLLFNMQTGFLL